METLALFFVGLVAFANSLAPQANLPKVLGVSVLGDETESTAPAIIDFDIEERSKEDLKRRLMELKGEKALLLEEARQKKKEAYDAARFAREKAKEETGKDREEFLTQLGEIKDVKKQATLKNLDERIAALNEKWTNHFNDVLGRLEGILAKIETRAEVLAGEGVDTTGVNAQIESAHAAIDLAQEAVIEQAGKTYVIDIEEEENLGENVSDSVRLLKADIKSVRDKVRIAKDAVREAYKALKEVSHEDDGEEESETITPGATLSPTI